MYLQRIVFLRENKDGWYPGWYLGRSEDKNENHVIVDSNYNVVEDVKDFKDFSMYPFVVKMKETF